jgi:RimJ/RimL family protein N-acetyltransferase
MAARLPVGPEIDPTPARRPEAVRLRGHFGAIEKLNRGRHGAALWHALRHHDDVWTYMSYGPFEDQETFLAWVEQRAALPDPFSYAVVDVRGDAVGIVTLMEIRPAMRVIEVGNIVYAPALQRTPLATEAQYLMARHALETLGYRRYEWKCNALNAPSRGAALRFGFTFEGIFRNHMIVKGRSRDTAWYAMFEEDWPVRRAAFERWLARDNFDHEGRQRVKLGVMMRESAGGAVGGEPGRDEPWPGG